MRSTRPQYSMLRRNDGEWQYKIGKGYVTLYSPDGKRLTVDCSEVARYGSASRADVLRWLDAMQGVER